MGAKIVLFAIHQLLGMVNDPAKYAERSGVLRNVVWRNLLFNLNAGHSHAGRAYARLSGVNKQIYTQ